MVVNDLFHSPNFGENVLGEEKSQPRPITMADFKEIVTRRKPSVSMEMIRAYYKWSEQFKAL
jgi:SpoVK/Ycf46/Vps4 family AAA+-type ATPase